MAIPRTHLGHAPIVEAVVDVRVLARDGVGPQDLRDASRLIGAGYDAQPLRSLQARFGIEDGREMPFTTTSADVGWLFKFGPPERPTAIAQFRMNGFTFNKLEPYSTWDQVFGEADRLWRIYVGIASPLEVTRMAVRYINRMRFPSPAELREYLEAPPVLPTPIPQTIQEFLTRVVVYDAERDASAIITQALEAPIDPTAISVLLDIDAFHEEPLQPTDPSMPRIFEVLRRLKNDIFYASVTEKTVEMFE